MKKHLIKKVESKNKYFIQIEVTDYNPFFGLSKKIVQGIQKLSDSDISKIDGKIIKLQQLN